MGGPVIETAASGKQAEYHEHGHCENDKYVKSLNYDRFHMQCFNPLILHNSCALNIFIHLPSG